MSDISLELQELVRKSVETKSPLRIVGGNSKAFYGRYTEGTILNVSRHRGIVNYEPTELVITARGATPLAEIEATLAENNQILGFEPPHFGNQSTLAGTMACGFSGPRRPFAGAVRDFVLGCKLLNGKAEILRFGGEVMKNVAGYDISRLMAGALGTLGILLEVSIRTIPKPPAELTLAFETDFERALVLMTTWCRQPSPISALCFDGNRVFARISGSEHMLASAQKVMGGEVISENSNFWTSVRNQDHSFFESTCNLWRLSLAPASPKSNLPGEWFLDWGGAQRWLKTDAEPKRVFQIAAQTGGHSTLYRSPVHTGDKFQPQPSKLMQLHKNLKQAFDPSGILNPGRMYSDF